MTNNAVPKERYDALKTFLRVRETTKRSPQQAPEVRQAVLLRQSEAWYSHLLFILGILSIAMAFPPEAFVRLWDAQTGLFVSLGTLAIWRYGWGVLHFFRALYYRGRTFPRLRHLADDVVRAQVAARVVPYAYLLVTSFRVDSDTSALVYAATFRAALAAPGGATVVASIVDIADQRLVTASFRAVCGTNSSIRLIIVRIRGSGKRDALAHGFRAISRAGALESDIVAVIDGDSVVPVDLVYKCLGFFADPKVGALTTDEVSEVRGPAIFHLWYSLRFAQRNILMASNGLAGRVLTLTGRMSMFRAGVICDPTFVAQVEDDSIEHWRLGRIKFLTGDDKSSWFWLLRHGYKMLYVPDIVVSTVEVPPSTKFVPAAAQLMTRWFGNMLRTNGRALKLGPSRIGYFTWWAIFDQRISMWTSLTGVAIVFVVAALYHPIVILGYLIWVLTTRYLLTLLLFQSRPRVSALYPFLIYFNQIFGSLIKTYIFFRLDKQRWTRQKTTLDKSGAQGGAAIRALSSAYMHVLGLAVFVTLVAWMIGELPIPGRVL